MKYLLHSIQQNEGMFAAILQVMIRYQNSQGTRKEHESACK